MEETFVGETKLEQILIERGMSQGDLMRLIKQKSGFKIGRDRISKITTGRMKNYSLETAVMIAEALDIPVDYIVELKNIKKENSVK
jgi:transcriptional regulator with XRE-family HTH domain